MSAPYPPEVIAQQQQIIADLTSRPGGALFDEVATALGIKIGGASYRINVQVAAGKLWVCGDGRTTRKRAFSSIEGMRAWQDTQPPTFSQIVQDLLSINQPVTAAQLGKAVGLEPKRASGYLWPMANRGEIFGVQCGHMWFWYRTAEAAEKGKARAEAEAKRMLLARNAALVSGNTKRRRAIPAGVVLEDVGATFRERTAQITSETKVTIAEPPRYHHRWQQQDDSGPSLWEGMPKYGTGA